MTITLPNWFNTFYERDRSGKHWYYMDNPHSWGLEGSNLEVAQNHPILTPGILFLSNLFSQANIWVEDKRTGKKDFNHPLLQLLDNPNYYQTGMDLMESLMFMKIAQGRTVMYFKRPLGFLESKDIDTIYLLDVSLIKYPEGFITPMKGKSLDRKIGNQIVLYDEQGENLKIKLKDLLFFYDLPNGLNKKNKFKTRSRLDGLRQTLINTVDSLTAKNIILKTNGKELITGKKDGLMMSPDEKEDAEQLFQTGYGLGFNRKRALITKAEIQWKSMHIALRDLGLDESVKVDGNLIYTALHIPKDILSLEAKKTTYNNFKESMVSYIQNEMQPHLDSVLKTLEPLLEDTNLKLVGSYEHLAIMQFVLIERYTGISLRAKALNDLLMTGIPQEEALVLCGFDKNLKLEDIQALQSNENEESEESKQKDADIEKRIEALEIDSRQIS